MWSGCGCVWMCARARTRAGHASPLSQRAHSIWVDIPIRHHTPTHPPRVGGGLWFCRGDRKTREGTVALREVGGVSEGKGTTETETEAETARRERWRRRTLPPSITDGLRAADPSARSLSARRPDAGRPAAIQCRPSRWPCVPGRVVDSDAGISRRLGPAGPDSVGSRQRER